MDETDLVVVANLQFARRLQGKRVFFRTFVNIVCVSTYVCISAYADASKAITFERQ